jgi:hypothetical protein
VGLTLTPGHAKQRRLPTWIVTGRKSITAQSNPRLSVPVLVWGGITCNVHIRVFPLSTPTTCCSWACNALSEVWWLACSLSLTPSHLIEVTDPPPPPPPYFLNLKSQTSLAVHACHRPPCHEAHSVHSHGGGSLLHYSKVCPCCSL